MDSSSSSSAHLGWVMFDRSLFRRDDVPLPSDNPTVATGKNSRGDDVGIWLRLCEPPEPSEIYFKWPDSKGDCDWVCVVGATQGFVLLQMGYLTTSGSMMFDYFVCNWNRYYRNQPLLLELLPPLGGTFAEVQAGSSDVEGCRLTDQHLRRLDCLDLGINTSNPFAIAVVAELEVIRSELPKLRVCHHHLGWGNEWKLSRPSILAVNGSDLDVEKLMWNWDTDTVIPFGSFLCFVDYCNGVLFCNVLSDSPKLQYLELPSKIPGLDRFYHGRAWSNVYQTVGVTDNGRSMKFLSVVRDDGLIDEELVPGSGFTVTSWILWMGPKAWKMEGVDEMMWKEEYKIKSDELCGVYEDATLPRKPLQYPILSLDQRRVVYFVLRQEGEKDVGYSYDDTWIVAIGMNTKKLMKTFKYITATEKSTPEVVDERIKHKYWYFEAFLPAHFPNYLLTPS